MAVRGVLEARGRGPAYKVTTASRGAAPVTTSSGLTLVPGGNLPDLREAEADTLVVPSGSAGASAGDLAAWLRRNAAHVRRITSVCTDTG